jgi:lysozyme
MKSSENVLKIIEEFECSGDVTMFLTAYWDKTGKVWTIGYGSTRISGIPVQEHDVITAEEAKEIMLKDLQTFESEVTKLALNINQNQFDSLVDFCYNAGQGNFLKSTLLKKIRNNTNDPAIQDEFEKWKFSGGVELAGLLRRRKCESHLFTTGILQFIFT